MSHKIQFRRGEDEERGTVVLDSGEPGWSTDTKKLYVGDGETYGGVLVTGALCDLETVNCGGTENGKVLTYQSGTWVPQTPAGGGDMLISQYVTGQGTVYNASRLEGETLAAVQAHGVDAGTITQGTIGLARIPTVDDARIPDLETLSYGAAFGTAQMPSVGAYKISSGTLAVARHETLDNLNGTVALSQIPTMNDAHIPDLETLSYGAAFGTAQIPSVGAYKIASGTLNADRIPALPTTRITSGTFDDERIPDIGVTAINYVIDGGGVAIGTGIKGDLEVPFACHVNRWTLLADQHGSIVVDIWRDSYANFPPTDADSMSGTTNMPAISGTIAAQGTNLSGWGTVGISAGDVLRYHVDSCTSIQKVTLALRANK